MLDTIGSTRCVREWTKLDQCRRTADVKWTGRAAKGGRYQATDAYASWRASGEWMDGTREGGIARGNPKSM